VRPLAAALLLVAPFAGAPDTPDVPAAGASAETSTPIQTPTSTSTPVQTPTPTPTPTPENPDLAAARIAWRYFERNTHAATGLVNSVEGYPSTTAWDLGSSVLAALSAYELGILGDAELEARLSALLRTLEALPLFEGELPNKAYHAETARMTDYANRPAPGGIGFSAVDLGRLVSALALTGDLHPWTRERIARALARWNTCRLVGGGELHGVHRGADGRLRRLQEGRLGYEQYAGKALALLGLDTSRARSYGRFLAETPVFGVPVPHDARERARYGAVDALVTEPWALDGLEFGLGGGGAPLAARVFEVQKRRWERTGIATALSEDHVDRPPWFVYDGILAGGAAWVTVDPEGKEVAGLRGLSTKAAFALAALHPDDPYAEVLRRAAGGARDPERGWFAGTYEAGGPNRALTANTNGVVLETILFRRRGPLHAACGDCEGRAAWRARLAAVAERGPACPRQGADAGAGAGVAPPRAAAGLGIPPPDRGPAGTAPRRSPDGPRADGSLLATYRGAEGPGIGGVATVWPWRAAFLRAGAEATPRSDRGDTRLIWGFGWDDWHPGTFSLTVHNWGPLRPDDVPGWRGAELNLGYKLPRFCSEWLCVAPVASVTVPFTGGPYADLRTTFTIAGRWFAMGGLGRTIPDVFEGPAGTPRWRMVYGFGRWSWRPGSLFVTYHDWGPDWRARNGVLSLGMNWAF
jgi:hypothetical protein